MIEVEVFGADAAEGLPSRAELTGLCAAAAARLDVEQGHVAIELVDARRIAELNLEHRGEPQPTDVLSFPIDGGGAPTGGVPAELGDIVICPAHTADIREAVVHGMLHLLGMDHETDHGEMLCIQDEVLTSARR